MVQALVSDGGAARGIVGPKGQFSLLSMLELGATLGAERDAQRLLTLFCRAARTVLRCAVVGLVQQDETNGAGAPTWLMVGTGGTGQPASDGSALHGLIARAASASRATRVAVKGIDASTVGLPVGHPAINELLAVPLRLSRGLTALLYCADRDDTAPFDADDEQLAERLAIQLSASYGNFLLAEEVRRNSWQMHQELLDRRGVEAELRDSEMRFRQLADNVRSMFFLVDPADSQTVYVSPAYEQIWGRSCRSLYEAPRSWTEAVHPDDLPIVAALDQRRATVGHFEYRFRIVRDGGEVRWIQAKGFPVFDAGGVMVRVAGICDDVTDSVLQAQQIARLDRIRAVTSGISSAMLRLHNRTGILQEACRLAVTGGAFELAWASSIDPETGAATKLAQFGGGPDDAGQLYRAGEIEGFPLARLVLEKRGTVMVKDFDLDKSLGKVGEELLARGYRCSVSFPIYVRDRVDAVLILAMQSGEVNAEEVALLERMTADLSYALTYIETSRQLNHLAYYDALTGLPNIALLADRVSQLIAANASNGTRVGIAVLDLERFGQLNDALGRSACDGLLRRVGERLRASVPETWTVARIASDTFAIAANLEGDATAVGLRERALNSLREPFDVDGRTVMLAAQLGIAVHPGDGDDFASLFKSAASALNQARSSGAPYAWYSSELTTRIAQRLQLEQELRLAVERNEFLIYYQPRADLRSGEMVGAEALIRWMHPQDGIVSPLRFIGLAEEIGLIVPIGMWVIESVCAQMARWIALGLDVVPVAVNLSPLQFRQEQLFDNLAAALRKHRIEPHLIDFEITESAVMADPEHTVVTLDALRALGCGLALDDFGTGYSSLSQLKKFPFNALKVDRSFVIDITHNAEDAAIATAIIAMGQRLGLKLVAEGVETEGQLAFLRDKGCDEIQGNLFGAAQDVAVFESWLRERKRLVLPKPADASDKVLLIVDDEQSIRSALTRILRRDGYRILIAASGKDALDLLAVNPVQVIISDQRMPDMSGTEFLQIVKQLYPDTMRIILSGYTDLQVVTDSVNRGSVFKFLTKPWDDELLREQVRDAFRRFQPTASTAT